MARRTEGYWFSTPHRLGLGLFAAVVVCKRADIADAAGQGVGEVFLGLMCSVGSLEVADAVEFVAA